MNFSWNRAATILREGGVVIIPSDSAYGIAAVAANHTAISRLYALKEREPYKPSLLIVSSVDQAQDLIEFTDLAKQLTETNWPGGLTIVGTARNTEFSPLIYGAEHTLALRLPNKQELVELATEVGPFILPSANLAGQPTPFHLYDLDSQLITAVDYVLEEETDGKEVSTLVDIRGPVPKVIRQGSVKILS
jgi:tRNA threonylcarbamoyl adenosine modification protein (Sua5/YciO/YrdC/YwlC family)